MPEPRKMPRGSGYERSKKASQKPRKPRFNPDKLSPKQNAIMAVLRAAEAPLTPSQVGEGCGMARGLPAAQWAYSVLKKLATRGLIEKVGPAQYRIPG